MSGQTLNDRLTAARHALAGQGLARIVCKATTEEVLGPKKKHLDYLLHCTNEPNVSIPQLANLLIERTQNTSWVVVFKALITVHHLMCYGNERFTQYLASSNCTFQLGHFLDKVGVQSYDMSTFIRRYAKYLNEKAVSYRSVAFDFCKCKRGKEDGILRQMNTEQLLKTLPALQNQLDSLLEFDCSANDLCNGVVNSCFMLLFRDLIRLFACYNDGIINLLEKYFDMNKKHCRDALDIYKKFLIRMDRVAEFLKVAEAVGIDKGEIPDLTRAPSSLLEALEQHLATLEGRKGSTSAASAAASAGEGGSPQQEINGIKVDESVRKAVEEEAEIMNQLKFDNDSPLLWEQPAWEDSERRLKEMGGDMISPPSGSTKTNPFLSSPCEPPANSTTPMSNQKIIDLFNTSGTSPGDLGGDITPASDDLLGLNSNISSNPFADSLFGGAPTAQPRQEQNQFAAFTNGFGSSSTNSASMFASDASFAAAFGDTSPANQASPVDNTTITSPAPLEKETTKLSLPVLDSFAGRSASPSPTTELMRGAGTTPILAAAPDGGFGDAAEDAAAVPQQPSETSAAASSDYIWGSGTGTASTPSAATAVVPPPASLAETNDFFGTPFEPTPPSALPTAVVTPLSVQTEEANKMDLFGFESSDFGDFGEQPLSAQPCAPPPSPFGGLDLVGAMTSGPDLRAQAIANAVGATQRPPSGGGLGGGLDDLNFAIHQAMQKSPSMSPSLPHPPYMGQAPLSPAVVSSGLPGNVTPTSALGQLGGQMGFGTPPGYGTPTSGMSSPAKSVTGMGVPMTVPGGFDAFGDTLQPHVPPSKPAAPAEKQSGGSSILKGDLDSTLANLASNLDINGPKLSMKKTSGHQWGSPKPPAKATGPGGGWTAPAAVVPIAPGTGQPNPGWSASPQHGFQPMAAQSGGGQWGGGMMGGNFPQQPAAPGVFPQQSYMGGGVRPAMGGGMGMGATTAAPQQAMYGGGFVPQVPLVPSANQGLPSQAPVNDPFGAL